jgi:hypothetical protein
MHPIVYNYYEDRVVVDDNVITSRSPGTSFLFALTIVEHLVDLKVNQEINLLVLIFNINISYI